MKPAAFAYAVPDTAAEALELLSSYGDEAKILAGGQSLVPLLNMRLAVPALLVDINRVKGFDTISDNGRLTLSPLVRQTQLERWPELRRSYPLLSEAIRWVGHSQIRNRGTVLGSLAHADPAAELPVAFQALEGEMEITGPRGSRTVSAIDFFQHIMTTSVQPDEMLTGASLTPIADGVGSAFLEVARRHGDFAVASVAIVITLGNGVINRARIAMGGVGPVPLRALHAEASLEGFPAGSDFSGVGAQAAAETQPVSDVHGTAEYRRDLMRVLVNRGVQLAVESAARRTEDAAYV